MPPTAHFINCLASWPPMMGYSGVKKVKSRFFVLLGDVAICKEYTLVLIVPMMTMRKNAEVTMVVS